MKIQPLSCLFAFGATLALFPSLAGAQTLYTGGLNSLFTEGDPVAGNFVVIGACGGSITSMVESYEDLYLGDTTGQIYIYHGNPDLPMEGITAYAFNAPAPAVALADYGGTLLSGAANGTISILDKRDGSVEGTFTIPDPVGAMLRVDHTLYVGTGNLNVFKIDLIDGTQSLLGTCAGEVRSMAKHGDELILGTPSGLIYLMNANSGIVTGAYLVPNNASALVMDDDVLLVGGSSGSVLRVNPTTGLLLGTIGVSSADISTMAISLEVLEPGFPFCFGIDCPCANLGATGGCSNSLGRGAEMRAQGSNSVLADDLVITVDQLPANSWGIVYMGSQPNHSALGDGILCTGGGYPLYRFPIQNSGPGGSITQGTGLAAYASLNFDALGQITPGGTQLFQIWYRNPTGPCGVGFNTSNGYSVSFSQ
jgi:hypothetical protein